MDETPESQEEVLDELLEETLDESLEKAMASEDFLKIPKEFFGTGPLLMPVIFEAKDALQISNRDGISHWTATITAYRDQKPERVFENVGFITPGPQAHIEGIQLELNDPLWANHELARSQREFITYLHDEPRRKIERNGFMTRIFQGSELRTQAEATASFMALCDGLTEIALGYYDHCDKFHHAILDGTELIKQIRRRTPFNSLGE